MKIRSIHTIVVVVLLATANLSTAQDHGTANGLTARAAADEVTPVNLDGDISGDYRLSAKDGEKTIDFKFFLVRTPMTIKGRDGKEYPFYGLSKSWYDNIKEKSHLLGIYVTPDDKAPGKYRLHYLYVSKGKPIDGESSMLLSQEGNTLIFGGDFEKQESFRIEKVSDKQY